MPLLLAEVEFGQRREGIGRRCDRGNEDGLVRFGEVSPSRTKFQEEALRCGDAADRACHGRVVRVPWLDDGRDGRSESLSERRQGKAIEDHGERVALSDALSREDDLAFAAAPTKEELGRVPVAVKTEPGTIGPAVAHGPEHAGLAAKLIEAVGRIDQEDGRGFLRGQARVFSNGLEGLLHRQVREGD